MASFSEVKEVRLKIADPQPVSGSRFINFIQVANQAALPSPSARQTAYNTLDTGEYWSYGGTAYQSLDLQVSDDSIEEWIDAVGVMGAARKSVEMILAGLPVQFQIVKNDSGTESNEFIKLGELQKFYENLLKMWTPVDSSSNTGKYFKTVPACIAGGNL